jgi:hypothetical protein
MRCFFGARGGNNISYLEKLYHVILIGQSCVSEPPKNSYGYWELEGGMLVHLVQSNGPIP